MTSAVGIANPQSVNEGCERVSQHGFVGPRQAIGNAHGALAWLRGVGDGLLDDLVYVHRRQKGPIVFFQCFDVRQCLVEQPDGGATILRRRRLCQ